jgi:hypothetical protein
VDHEDKNNTVRIGVYTSELIDKLYYDYWQYCWQILIKTFSTFDPWNFRIVSFLPFSRMSKNSS